MGDLFSGCESAAYPSGYSPGPAAEPGPVVVIAPIYYMVLASFRSQGITYGPFEDADLPSPVNEGR